MVNFKPALSCNSFAITLALSNGLFRESETMPLGFFLGRRRQLKVGKRYKTLTLSII